MRRKLMPEEVGRSWLRSARRYRESGPHQQCEFKIFLGVSGQMSYFIDGEIVELRAQDLMFVQSGSSHFLVSESSDFDMEIISVSPELMADSGIQFPIDSSPRTLDFQQAEYLQHLSRRLRVQLSSSILSAGLTWWVHTALDSWVLSTKSSSIRLHSSVVSALAAINEDPSVSIKEIIRNSNITSSHLAKLFKVQVGQTMQSYRSDKRFEVFEKLVDSGQGMTLLNAAIQAGFSDYANFYRAFCSRFGCSPRQYFERNSS